MSCTPLAAYALRCGYGLAAASSGTRATGPAERATCTWRATARTTAMRAERATANVRPTPLHGTSTRIATNRESCGRPEMSCAKVQKERLPLASRVSNVKLYTR